MTTKPHTAQCAYTATAWYCADFCPSLLDPGPVPERLADHDAARRYCYCLEADDLGPAVLTEWCPVHGDMPRKAILKMVEESETARVRDEAVAALREIADENHPLWDADAWPFAKRAHQLARAFFAAHPAYGETTGHEGTT